MKKIFRIVAIALVCGMLAMPVADAQNRGRGNGGNTHRPATTPTQTTRPGNTSRPSNNSRPGNSGQGRPGNNGQGPSAPSRPVQPSRPNQPSRPGGSTGPSQSNRPGNNHGSNPGYNPGYRPGGPGYNPTPPPPGNHGPVRPNMPPPRPFNRPAPPPAGWRPYSGWRPFNTILGVALGTAFNMSLNALINSGYTVNSYGNNTIYLDNVQMLNMWWPDAALYFNNVGQLYASRFIYSTLGYDPSRYDMVYTTLMSNYGSPVSINNTGNGVETTWWGPGNQFIHLSYKSDYSAGGGLRYYTILSFGN